MRLSELPRDCLCEIFSHTTPLEVCKAACVCRSLWEVARSDTTWRNLLPSDYPDVGLPADSGKRKLLERLAEGVSMEGGTQLYKLLWRSGGVCRLLSASAMRISWGDDSRFWRWETSRSSCFGKTASTVIVLDVVRKETNSLKQPNIIRLCLAMLISDVLLGKCEQVARLLAVCWFEVSGSWSLALPSGTYSLLWRLKVANPQGGRMRFLSWKKPLNFFVSFCDDHVLEKQLDLLQLPSSTYEEWLEFEVGQIRVRGKKGIAEQLNLEFFVRELDCSFWKGGLFLDCLTLRPTDCEDEIYSNQPDRLLSKVRGRPGVF